MIPTHHIPSTSVALYRVFIAPNLRATTSVPLLYAPAFAQAPSFQSSNFQSPLPRTQIRTKTWKKDTERHALTDHYTLDRAIRSRYINLVTPDGEFLPDTPIEDALMSIDLRTHHLLQVTPGKVDQFGNIDPDSLPTCRVISKMALREQHQKKLDTMRQQAKGASRTTLKQLEVNWAIAGGDLKHRLGRLREFLKDGKKVEVVFGPKKQGRQASAQEANAVLKAFRDVVADIRGASEVKSEGDVGAVMTVTFEGRKLKEKEKEKEAEGAGQ